MIVANIQITYGRFALGGEGMARIGFDNAEAAYAEYDRLVKLLDRREERANDLPKTVTVDGAAGCKWTGPLGEITGISLSDFAKQNEQEVGLADAFPHLFKKR